MKTLKFSFVVIAILSIASISQLNAQAEHVHFPAFYKVLVDCANGGAGEWAEGTLYIHRVIDNHGGYVGHVQSGYLIGQLTNIKYKPVGVTVLKFNAITEDGATTQSWVNRFFLIGKGTKFYVKENFHVVTNSEGTIVTRDNTEVICK